MVRCSGIKCVLSIFITVCIHIYGINVACKWAVEIVHITGLTSPLLMLLYFLLSTRTFISDVGGKWAIEILHKLCIRVLA